jgi:deoxyribodipyrimidine photo-lyase
METPTTRTTPPAPEYDRALVWFRRDLRLHDHAALWLALKSARQVLCGFVFDTQILDPLPRADRRVAFIRGSLEELDRLLREATPGSGSKGLVVRHGPARETLPRLAQELGVQAVFTNHDYEPAAKLRDAQVRGTLAHAGISFYTAKDQVVFEGDELLTVSGNPYSVFTPYKNAWLKKLEPFYLKAYPCERWFHRLAALPGGIEPGVPRLSDIDFEELARDELKVPPGSAAAREMLDEFLERIDDYADTRDFPGVKGPSYLSTHLRFGTLSIREVAALAWDRMRGGSRGAEVWLSELIWRDFYHQVLHHHPQVAGHAFKPAYDRIRWDHGKHADELFHAWCEGRTGYPLVDAAMAQINQTGYMHNRLRMVVASFLTKDLGIDWRRGEAWFAEKLLDFDLAANNGGWQWAASSGCDAQPYFRIFNPVSQSRKFDPQGRFIRRYLPQLSKLPDEAIHAPWLAKPLELEAAGIVLGRDYPRPLVQHDEAREKTLARYAVVKEAG